MISIAWFNCSSAQVGFLSSNIINNSTPLQSDQTPLTPLYNYLITGSDSGKILKVVKVCKVRKKVTPLKS